MSDLLPLSEQPPQHVVGEMGEGEADSGNGDAAGDGPPPRKLRVTDEGSSCVEIKQDENRAEVVIKEERDQTPEPPLDEAFYMGMKAFLASLNDYLSEKVVVLQELELTMFTLLQKQATFLWKRRQQELQSEAIYLDNLAARSMDYIPQTDEVVLSSEARNLLVECAARRLRRRQARESSGIYHHEEGMSSDDEVYPSQRANFQNRRRRLLQRCHGLFSGVSEEFSDFQKILMKLQEWREQFTDSYYEAHPSLCLPQVFAPFIKIQLLDWNPLKWGFVPLQYMPWFRALETFAKAGEFVAAPPDNQERPDRQILFASLDTTVLPQMTGFVRSLWNPLSLSQTKSIVELCREILRIGTASGVEGRQSTRFQDLVDAAVSRLNKAIEDDVFIPLYPKRFVDDKASQHSRFQERQFWSAVKLLGNTLLWNGFINEEVLRELALDKLLNRYLVVGLSNTYPRPGVAKKFRMVVESLPESWLQGSLPELCSLTQVVLRAAQQFHDEQLKYDVEEMVPLMVKLNALKQTRAFLEKNQLDLLKFRGKNGSAATSRAAFGLLTLLRRRT